MVQPDKSKGESGNCEGKYICWKKEAGSWKFLEYEREIEFCI